MTALLSWYGALADHHPRVVFALASFLGCVGVISLTVPLACIVGRRLAERDERAEG